MRLKKLQAQAKNFCRVLDIRVPQIVETNVPQSVLLQKQLEVVGDIIGTKELTHFVHAYIVKILLTVGLFEQGLIPRLFLSLLL